LFHRVSGKIHQQPPVSLAGAFPRHFLDKANVLGKEHFLDVGFPERPVESARVTRSRGGKREAALWEMSLFQLTRVRRWMRRPM